MVGGGVNLADVMDEVAAQLDTITGLRAFAYPPDALVPPAAVVSYPDEVSYDQTYARGMDRITLPVVVLVGKASDRMSRDTIAGYVDGTGAGSIKAVVEAGTYTACDTVRVSRCEFDVVRIAGIDYLAALFELDITGQGA
ncbi:MAG TPA: hypothetical protein VJP77_07775 [Planctomycetota bacterium]|nr:hypothetical protein [Planctomycetota bacterium]